MYQIAYYDDSNVSVNGYICDTFEQVIEIVSRLNGFKHIDILEFEREELYNA